MPAGSGRTGSCSRPMFVCFCDALVTSREPAEPNGLSLPVRGGTDERLWSNSPPVAHRPPGEGGQWLRPDTLDGEVQPSFRKP